MTQADLQTVQTTRACTLVSGFSVRNHVDEYLDASDPSPPDALSTVYLAFAASQIFQSYASPQG
ncbi:Uncharacterised protein [Vibrio cholerae]|nr:Uncharacterised protein [Vibrio cholerae]CSB45630.1 Uncharacterised protein [Vibrio cholerae]CSB83187.1 Uncharacterised protein [Vibrio cholerae]CSC89498.1 Uncharacterised protein [Vibrio cholerae]